MDTYWAKMIKRNNYTDRTFSDSRHMTERSACETVFFDLVGSKQVTANFKIVFSVFSGLGSPHFWNGLFCIVLLEN